MPATSLRVTGSAVLLVALACGPLLAVGPSNELLAPHPASIDDYAGGSLATLAQQALPSAGYRLSGLDGAVLGRAGAGTGGVYYPLVSTGGSGSSCQPIYFVGDVNLYTGNVDLVATDISLPSDGFVSGVGRTFNQTGGGALAVEARFYASGGHQGNNWFQTSQPELIFVPGATAPEDLVYLVTSSLASAEFRRKSGTEFFEGVNGAVGVFQHAPSVEGSLETWTYHNVRGGKTVFFGEAGLTNAGAAMQRWYTEDRAGNKAYAGHATSAATAQSSGYDGTGRLVLFYDTEGREYEYDYTSGHLDSVTVTSGGSTVASVAYEYYAADGANGLEGQLRLATVTTPLSDAGVSLTRSTYYRYYGVSGGVEEQGYGLLHMVLEAEGVRRFGAGGLDAASDNDLKPYASAVYTYDTDYETSPKVLTAFFNGQCGCGGAANGEYVFRYESAPGYSNASPAAYDPEPKRRAVVERPDGTWVTQYFDEAGQPLSRVTTVGATPAEGDPAYSPAPTQRWVDYVERDSKGIVIRRATPEAVTGYTHSSSSFTVSTSAGETWQTKLDTGATLRGMPTGHRVANGNTFSDSFPITPYVVSTAYKPAAESYQTLAAGLTTAQVYRPVIASTRSFPDAATATNPASGGDLTSYSYTYWNASVGNVDNLLPKVITTTLPLVSTGNNGSNASDTRKVYLRKDGTVAFVQDEQGVLTYTAYNRGQLAIRIEDADPNGGLVGLFDANDLSFGLTSSGSYKNLLTSYSYDAQGRLSTVTLPSGRVTAHYYSKLSDGQLVTLSFPRRTGSDPSFTRFGPAGYAVSNLAGKTTFSATLAVSGSGVTSAPSGWVDEGLSGADPIDSLSSDFKGSGRASVYRPILEAYDPTGTRLLSSKAFHTIATSGAWDVSTARDLTSYDHDTMGRLTKVTDPTGTIDKTVYDALGRVSERWVGTDDGTPGNMTQTERRRYDGATSGTLVSGKNSRLTSSAVDPDGNWGTTTDTRETLYAYDYRGRLLLETRPLAPHAFNAYDNLGRVTATGKYSSTASIDTATDSPLTEASGRMDLSETAYDQRGRVFRTTAWAINHSTGAKETGSELTTDSWYDPVGRVIKVRGHELTKTRYDRLGRTTHRFVLGKALASGGSAESAYADADDVAHDVVLSEEQTYFQDATGNPLMRVSIQRHHDEDNDSTPYGGALDSNADGLPGTLTAANVRGRVQLTLMWYDALDRLTDIAQYGTNGIVGDGSTTTGTLNRLDGAYSSAPTRSTTSLIISSVSYHEVGAVLETQAPTKGSDPGGSAGTKTRFEYDRLLRRTAAIANYVNGAPSSATGADDVFTRYAYANGLQTKMWADLDGDNTEDTDDQVTEYVFGVSESGNPDASQLASNRLMYKAVYPPQHTTPTVQAATDRDQIFSYNALGQLIRREDQEQVVVSVTLDKLGRVYERTASNIPGTMDSTVRTIRTSYAPRGHLEAVQQYDASSVLLDEIVYQDDYWGRPRAWHANPVGSTGGASNVSIFWTRERSAPADGRVTTRLQNQQYQINWSTFKTMYWGYGASGSVDDSLSRTVKQEVLIGSFLDGYFATASEYRYTGVDWVVRTDLPEADVYSALYAAGASTGTYDYLDPFNRVTSSRWTRDLASDVDFYRTDLSYDRNSNITSATDHIHKRSSGNRVFDALYTMDDLNRLVRAQEGNLSGGSITSQSRDEQWREVGGANALSQTGNWAHHLLNLNGDADFTDFDELNETRTHNPANEIRARDTDSNGTANESPVHNKRGDLTFGSARNFVYDAFGRLARVRNAADTATLAEYRYNGLGQRTGWHYDYDSDGTLENTADDPWIYFAYDNRWRVVAAFKGTPAAGTKLESYLYHGAGLDGDGSGSYLDQVVFRDRDTDGDGGLDERRYYCQNWRADVVALLTELGRPVEQVRYSPYGLPWGLPAGDVDADGDWDTDDGLAVYGAVNNADPYDVRMDLDRDGDADSDDFDAVWNGRGPTMGRGVLSSSSTLNRKGYGGYEQGGFQDLWHARHRVLDSGQLGRWLTRDPAGYQDGLNLHSYVRARPVAAVDPYGLAASLGLSTAAPVADMLPPGWTPPPPPPYCPITEPTYIPPPPPPPPSVIPDILFPPITPDPTIYPPGTLPPYPPGTLPPGWPWDIEPDPNPLFPVEPFDPFPIDPYEPLWPPTPRYPYPYPEDYEPRPPIPIFIPVPIEPS